MPDSTAPAAVALHQSVAHRRPAGGWLAVVAVSVGGVVGALGRYGLSMALPHDPGRFPWGTFVTNITGCLLIGVLLALLTEVWSGHRLLRPFLGVGVLGGFTTFSGYILEIQDAIAVGANRIALAYLGGTVVGALAAVWVGVTVTRWAYLRRRRRR